MSPWTEEWIRWQGGDPRLIAEALTTLRMSDEDDMAAVLRMLPVPTWAV